MTMQDIFADLAFADLWGMRIPVVSRRALLRAKQEAGRPKDRIDFDELTKAATNPASTILQNPVNPV